MNVWHLRRGAAAAFVMIVALLLTGNAQAAPCTGKPKSKNANVAVSVTFVNKSGQHRSVMWADYKGKWVNYASLESGASQRVDTFATHAWIFTDRQGNCVETFVSRKGVSKYTLTVKTGGGEDGGDDGDDDGGGDDGGGGAADQQAFLNAHNNHRARHCVPAVVWSAEIAATAQTWANGCKFGHDNNSSYGENIAMGTSLTAKQAVDLWYSEVSAYDFGTPGYKNGIGHFTQIVWRATTEIGCGLAKCSNGVLVVCRYSPPGNFTGEFPENVLPACK